MLVKSKKQSFVLQKRKKGEMPRSRQKLAMEAAKKGMSARFSDNSGGRSPVRRSRGDSASSHMISGEASSGEEDDQESIELGVEVRL